MSLFDEWNKEYGDTGLGDTVSRAINTVSGGKIKECGGCKNRKAKLNKLIKYSDTTTWTLHLMTFSKHYGDEFDMYICCD